MFIILIPRDRVGHHQQEHDRIVIYPQIQLRNVVPMDAMRRKTFLP